MRTLIPFVGKILCLFVALTPRLSTQQGINIFWYVDVNDLAPGKSPDLHIRPGSPPYGTPDIIPSDEIKKGVDVADVIRGSVVPPGSNIIKMNWDKDLNTKVTDAAKRCEGFTNDPSAGEIVVASTSKLTIQEALSMVKAEGAAAYNFVSNTCAPKKQLQCQQYKLLLSAKVTSFACARAHCPDTALPYRVHCMLAPKPTPTELNDKPYISTGTPCQLCPRDRGYCYNNLCVSHGEKEVILKENPTAVVTCSAPCKNCGERKDINKVCACVCPTGFESALDCSVASSGANPSSLKCGPCGIAGTPCLNRGLDALEATCRCLCPTEFRGPRCEFQTPVFNGGINLPVGGPRVCAGTDCATVPPTVYQIPIIISDINTRIADSINRFCTKDQANYIRCCGTGTLPTSGPIDFVNPSGIQAQTDQAKYDQNGKLIIPLYATVKGNNGLCRKTTDDPTLTVPIPPDVLKEVINGGRPSLNPGCCPGTILDDTKNTIKETAGGGQASEVSIVVVTVI